MTVGSFSRLMKKRIKVKDIAGQCMVSKTTVRRWIKEGKLPAIRLPSGHYRINIADFRNFLKSYDILLREAAFKSKSEKKGGDK